METITAVFNPNNPLLYIILIWSLAWKGTALWKASRNNQNIWFICLFIINTVGILEIIYILFFQRNKNIDRSSRRLKNRNK